MEEKNQESLRQKIISRSAFFRDGRASFKKFDAVQTSCNLYLEVADLKNQEVNPLLSTRLPLNEKYHQTNVRM